RSQNHALMALQACVLLATGDIPNPRRLILQVGCYNAFTVGTEYSAHCHAVVALEECDFFPGVRIPNRYSVTSQREKPLSVSTQPRTNTRDSRNFRPSCGIPNTRILARSSDHTCTIGTESGARNFGYDPSFALQAYDTVQACHVPQPGCVVPRTRNDSRAVL